MNPVTVVNMVGTSDRKCTCKNSGGTWLGHWGIHATGQAVSKNEVKCIAKGCSNMAEVGAHVHDVGAKVTPWIVPFCQYHNKRPATDNIDLKPGNVMVACAKVDCDG